MNEYDVVVVGGGAAGLSAALVLTRARRRVAVVDAGEPRNAPAAHMQGFLGSRRRCRPRDAARRPAATRSPATAGELVRGTVTDVAARRGQRRLRGRRSPTGRRCRAAASWSPPGCATSSPTSPASASAGAATCSTAPTATATRSATSPSACSAARPDAVAARPPGPPVVRRRRVLHPHRRADRRRARAARRPRHRRRRRPGRPARRRGRPADRRRARGRPASCAATRCSSAPPSSRTATCSPASAAPPHDNGWVVADATGRTSVPACGSPGNAVNPRAQVITAAGEGSAAAIAINADLVEEDVAGRRPRLPLTTAAITRSHP